MQEGPSTDPGLVTRLLSQWGGGRDEAFHSLVPLVYDDLRRIAHNRLRDHRGGCTLQTTEVVHEAWVQLADGNGGSWEHRAQFFAFSATVIRRILVDHARSRGRLKRGGDRVRVPLREDVHVPSGTDALDLVALDDALAELARHDPRLERLVTCRFFGGMTMVDAARALGISVRTAERDWTRAKAYLFDMLRSE